MLNDCKLFKDTPTRTLAADPMLAKPLLIGTMNARHALRSVLQFFLSGLEARLEDLVIEERQV